MTDKWMCMTVGVSFHHGNKEAAANKIRDIFNDDLREVRFVCNDTMWKSGEYFAFVLCSNYDKHLRALKDNSTFFKVVPSLESPAWISAREIDRFTISVKTEGTPDVLSRGDIVLVRNGHLKNLFGIVTKRGGKKSYWVSFRFYIRRFVEMLPGSSLQFVDNLFRHRKYPVMKGMLKEKPLLAEVVDSEVREALLESASHGKLHRQTHRKRPATGRGKR